MKPKTLIILVVLILVAVAGYFYFCDWEEEVAEQTEVTSLADASSKNEAKTQEVIEVTPAPTDWGLSTRHDYVCAGGKSIVTESFEGGIIRLSLSGKRVFTLELMSHDDEDGTKFANEGDETVLWIKDDSAFLIEKGTETYKACRLTLPESSEFPEVQ